MQSAAGPNHPSGFFFNSGGFDLIRGDPEGMDLFIWCTGLWRKQQRPPGKPLDLRTSFGRMLRLLIGRVHILPISTAYLMMDMTKTNLISTVITLSKLSCEHYWLVNVLVPDKLEHIICYLTCSFGKLKNINSTVKHTYLTNNILQMHKLKYNYPNVKSSGESCILNKHQLFLILQN